MNKAATSKELVRGVFQSAEVPRLPFVPWVFTHAARLEQVPVRRIYGDPTQYVKCLQNAQKLYGYDAIVGSFDASLEAELCGCLLDWRGDYETPVAKPLAGGDLNRISNITPEDIGRSPRMSTVIESLRRINMVSGSALALAAVVTGPLTLTATLLGTDIIGDLANKPEEAKKSVETAVTFLLKVIQGYCQLELDIITLADRLVSALPAEHRSWLQSTLSPVLNTIRFYNAFSVLLPGETSAENLADMINLGFDGIVTGDVDIDTWKEVKGSRSCTLGKAIPSRFLTSPREELSDYIGRQLPGSAARGIFLTTDWEVPVDVPPDAFHFLMKKIS